MFWKVRFESESTPPEVADIEPVGRFVLHRHTDLEGEHLDLRLECGGHLQGWRMDGTSLEGELWAREKAPHPVRWLDEDGEAVREDSGVYAWERLGPEGGVLLLEGREGWRRVHIALERQFTAGAAQAISEVLVSCNADVSAAAKLITDGVSARNRTIERLCALGRELDGSAFDDAVWRKTLCGLTLDEISAQLRAFEVRFDLKFPPQPVSRPEVLDGEGEESRADVAMSILRD